MSVLAEVLKLLAVLKKKRYHASFSFVKKGF